MATGQATAASLDYGDVIVGQGDTRFFVTANDTYEAHLGVTVIYFCEIGQEYEESLRIPSTMFLTVSKR